MSLEMRGEATLEIAAPADEIYALVSDVTRMGEWSPECVGGEWINGSSGPVVGAQFHGRNNRNGNEWTTPNTVLVAEPGREFMWVVGNPDFQVCRWRFSLVPQGSSTRVTESFELGEESVGFASTVMSRPEDERAGLIEARRSQLVQDMQHTLARLKERLESG